MSLAPRPFILALFLGIASLLAACGPAPQQAPSNVALWEVSGPHGEKAWLFGTVHVLPEGVEWQRPALDQALQQADRLVMEIAGPVNPSAVASTLEHLGRTPGLPDPFERGDSQQRATLKSAFVKLGIPSSRFADTESWSIALQIAGLASQQAGTSSDDGVETQLRRMAGQRPIIGLETIEGQFALFDQLPAPQQARLLEQTAAEIVSERDEERDLVRLWLAGDDAGIARETERGLLADPALRKVLLQDRNTAWAMQIEALLKQGARPFVAVGAAHLSGPDGLPALLAARGWIVTRAI